MLCFSRDTVLATNCKHTSRECRPQNEVVDCRRIYNSCFQIEISTILSLSFSRYLFRCVKTAAKVTRSIAGTRLLFIINIEEEKGCATLASPRLRDLCVSATAETIEDEAIYSSFPPVAFGVALKTTLMRVFCKEAAKRSVHRFDRCADQLIFGVCVRLRTFLCGSQRRKDCLTEMSPLTNKGPFKKLHFMACQLCVKTGLFGSRTSVAYVSTRETTE